MPMALPTRAVAAVAGWALHFLEPAGACPCVLAAIRASALFYPPPCAEHRHAHDSTPRPLPPHYRYPPARHPALDPVSTVSGLRAKLVSAACGPYLAISRHSTRGGRSRDAIPTPRKGQKSFLGPKPALPWPALPVSKYMSPDDCSWLLQKFRLFFLVRLLSIHSHTHPRPLVLTLPPRRRFTSLAFRPAPGQP
ncbi:hypothetical protein J3E72DRAFT_264949 [Bipolaris maydis]|nr:hypothetical protein J3E72DRAFT_264949 [Bipolaris maydis]